MFAQEPINRQLTILDDLSYTLSLIISTENNPQQATHIYSIKKIQRMADMDLTKTQVMDKMVEYAKAKYGDSWLESDEISDEM